MLTSIAIPCILIAQSWPPVIDHKNLDPIPVPYLEEANIPNPIPIDNGRQLFVDDYLVASTSGLVKAYFKPTKLTCNPLFYAETPAELALDTELGARPYPKGKVPWDSFYKTAPACAMPGGGVWWDAKRQVFRMWYLAGWSGRFATAESKDAIHWTRPAVGPNGTNVLLPKQKMDTFSVWPDYSAADPYSSWKLYISPGGNPCSGYEYVSTDGYKWDFVARTGLNGDSTTMFFNPFRNKWVWSIRAGWRRRSRMYHEHDDFVKGAEWNNPLSKPKKAADGDNPMAIGNVTSNSPDCVRWLACDNLDRPGSGLYNVDATPYESLTIGLFKIICGRDNTESAKHGMPKTTTIHFAYSRDGFHFSRPDRTPAIPDSGWGSGQWDSGYLGPCSSGFVIKDERLWFFYTGVRGDATEIDPPRCTLANGMHCNMSIGAATLRRDGFAGLVADGRGEVTTRPVRFSGSHLFVNAEVRFGSIAAEVLDENGAAIEGFSAADCQPLARVDTTRSELRWKGADLSSLAGKTVRFRFLLKVGTFYSFWVSPSERGESLGYLAAGGPAYPGLRDR